MNHIRTILTLMFLLAFYKSNAQQVNEWNGKKCAVVLTYDDALNVHLDNVIPCLDSFNIKGTFYLIGESPVLDKRISEWRKAAENGHELGNHSLTHPCDGRMEGRSWVTPDKDLSRYSPERVIYEIKITNTLLHAIDGKTERTFAFPCGDSKVDTINFYDSLKNDFAAARGVQGGLQHLNEIDLNDVRCYFIDGQSGDYMIDLVNKAMESHTLLVFLFHGVGGEHSINVSLEAHRQLIHYLKQHENDIWVAPMVDVARFIKESRAASCNTH
jgi:peptidoglycan-N-acetylglucosamine deacetylase